MAMPFRKTIQGNRSPIDTVSPHKLALLVVIREYLEMKGRKMVQMGVNEDTDMTTSASIRFMLLILDVMQGPDVELEELIGMLSPILKERHMQKIEERLKEMCTGGIQEVMDFMEKLATPIIAEYTVLNRNSVAGLFVRSMIAAFESMMFENVANLYDQYCSYHARWKPDPTTAGCKMGADKQPVGVYWSRKQAEQHLRRKAFLLEHCERAAGTPTEVRQDMVQLLKMNPSLTKTYYVDLLNSQRVKEYCCTMDNLHHYFDSTSLLRTSNQSAVVTAKKSDEDVNRSFRYAALTIASVCARFGHGEQAIAAVMESIRMAQEAGDNACLQHATSWLNYLNDQSSSCPVSHIDNAIHKSNELNLQQLSSLGFLTLAKQSATKRRPSLPSSVLQHVIQSEPVSCHSGASSHSHIHLLTTGLIQKASLWQAYGCSGMSSAFAQLLLSLNTNVNGTYHMAEQECLALCLLANQHFDQAMYYEAEEILGRVKSEFPLGSQLSPLWMFTSLLHDFQKAVYHCQYEAALHTCNNITAINQIEGKLRQAVLYKHLKQYDKAVAILQSLYELCLAGRIRNSAEYMIRVLLELGVMYCDTGRRTEGLSYLLECSALCAIHHRLHLDVAARLAIGRMQLMMGMADKATSTAEKALIFLYSSGSLHDQAAALLLLARCNVVQATALQKGSGSWRNVHLTTLRILNEVVSKLQKIESYQSLKEAYLLQAAVMNELGYADQRNHVSQRFRKLETELSSAGSAGCWKSTTCS